MARKFYCDCVGWDKSKMPALERLIAFGEPVERQDFLARVDARDMRTLEKHLGYDKNLLMSDDWHVTYKVERESQIPFFQHSAIEYVFANAQEIAALNEHAISLEEQSVLVIDRIGREIGQPPRDPDQFPDRFEEIMDELISHYGPVILVRDETDNRIAGNDLVILDRLIAQKSALYTLLETWVGKSEPPAGLTWRPGASAGAIAAEFFPHHLISEPEALSVNEPSPN